MNDMQNIRLIEEIEKCDGYEVVFITTFNFEIDFFERVILTKLLKKRIRNINIFVDSKQLAKTLNKENSSYIGKKYFLSPIKMNSSFHPKVLLFLGKNKAKVISGSANIKTSGYFVNNEVFDVYEVSEKDKQYANIVLDTIDFFKELLEISPIQDKEIKQYLYSYDLTRELNENINVIHNLKTSVLEQVNNFILEPVEEIKIAVPFYDDNLEALQEVCKVLNCDKCTLYIQNKTNSFPVLLNNDKRIIDKKRINIFENVKNNKNNNFYHGKFYQFIAKNNEYILYGSSNCTKSAVTKSFIENGNIEYNVILKSNRNQHDYYFDNFILKNDCELESDLFNYSKEKDNKGNFVFLYGEKNNNVIEFFFEFNKKVEIKTITYNGNHLDWEYNIDKLVVSIDLDCTPVFETILNIEIASDKIENNKCWYIDNNLLFIFRNDVDFITIPDYKVNDGYEKYMNYWRCITDVLCNNIKDIEKYTSIGKTQIGDDIENENQILEDDDEFIISTEVDDQYPIEGSISYALEKTLLLSNRYYHSILHNKKKQEKEYRYEKKSHTSVSRKATTEESRFSRFLKRVINQYLISDIAEELSFKSYKSITGIVFDVIHQFIYIEKVDDFLQNDYLLDIKLQILKIFVRKLIDNYEELDDEESVALIIRILVELSSVDTYKTELESIVYALDNKYQFKNNLRHYIEITELEDTSDIYKTKESKFRAIDNLTGYKSLDQLINYFSVAFNCEPKINVIGKGMSIDLNVQTFKSSISQKHIKEVAGFLDGNKIMCNVLNFNFLALDDRNVTYKVKVAGLNINSVTQINRGIERKCRLLHGEYKVNYFE